MDEITQQSFDNSVFERLAVFQALYKASADAVSSKDPYSIRSEANARLFELSEQTGADRVKLSVLGEPVGQMSICTTKAHAEITNQVAYNEWLVTNGMASVEYRINPDKVPDMYEAHPEWYDFVITPLHDYLPAMESDGHGGAIYSETGEVVPGVEWIPERPNGQTRITGLKPERVFALLQMAGIGFKDIAGFLESGQ